MFTYLTYEVADRIGTITLNRPEKRNALNNVVVQELTAAIRLVEADDAVKVVVLKANGKAFCAGADLDYLQQMQAFTPEENLADSTALGEMFMGIYRSSKVYIAQIEGHAIAGGCGLATICDFSFAVPEAQFGYTEVRIGFLPAIVMAFLLRKVGETRAREWLLSGNLYPAATAETHGLITRVIPAAEIAEYVQESAQRLVQQNSGASMAITKKMLADIPAFPIDQAVAFAARMNAISRGTPDCKAGIAAFLNKETPVW
jgi:methylglutaconyl-CoA hydratase